MQWKKAWPSELKDELRSLGFNDHSIGLLEKFGSIEDAKLSGPDRALYHAKKAAIEAALTKHKVVIGDRR